MTNFLVLTIIGDDKPGLVELLAETVASHHGNWLESSMSQLVGKFAGILRVSVADQDAEQLIKALHALSKDLKLVIEKVDERTLSTPLKTVSLSLIGNDRPGIIREISRVMAAKTVNVEQLNSECIPAPMSGDMLFKAKLLLSVPVNVELQTLQSELEKLADDLIVDIKLSQD